MPIPGEHHQWEANAKRLVQEQHAKGGTSAVLCCLISPEGFIEEPAPTAAFLNLQWEAAEMLGANADQSIVPPLISCLETHRQGGVGDEARSMAARVLGKMKASSAVDTLVWCLKTSQSQTRKNVVWALGKIGDPRAVDPLIFYLGNNKFGQPRMVAEALAKIGDSRAVEALIDCLLHKEKHVSEAADEALRKIGNSDVLKRIKKRTWWTSLWGKWFERLP